MRNLTPEEILEGELDDGADDLGYTAVEARIQELADLNVGTACGIRGNTCFKTLAAKGYGHRKCRGWLKLVPDPKYAEEVEAWGKGEDGPNVTGMFHIKIQTEQTGEKVERIAGDGDGSLRFDGPSPFEGYMIFEIE